MLVQLADSERSTGVVLESLGCVYLQDPPAFGHVFLRVLGTFTFLEMLVHDLGSFPKKAGAHK